MVWMITPGASSSGPNGGGSRQPNRHRTGARRQRQHQDEGLFLYVMIVGITGLFYVAFVAI